MIKIKAEVNKSKVVRKLKVEADKRFKGSWQPELQTEAFMKGVDELFKELRLDNVSNTLFVNQDKDGFTLSMHKTEFGAKKDRDERRIEDENVNTYEVTLFE